MENLTRIHNLGYTGTTGTKFLKATIKAACDFYATTDRLIASDELRLLIELGAFDAFATQILETVIKFHRVSEKQMYCILKGFKVQGATELKEDPRLSNLKLSDMGTIEIHGIEKGLEIIKERKRLARLAKKERKLAELA